MTRRTSGNTRRYKASAARRRAAAERDAMYAEKAADALTDPDLGHKITGLVGAASTRLLSYSVRNLGLLMAQAAERGITVTDVRSYDAWLAAGRQVRGGETSLRIVKPVTPRRGDREDRDDDAPVLWFRTAPVFDISQTDPIPTDEEDGDEEAAEAAAEADDGDEDPAAVLLASLTEQADKHGYRVDLAPAARPGAHRDRDARRIVVGGDPTAALPALVEVIADLAAERDRERERRREDGRAADRTGRAARRGRGRDRDEPVTITIA